MTSILAFLFVLGVLIFVHELGHFMMARRIGVRVLTFSLGFGPKLLSFRRGDTEYCVSAIPLGGYVKMAGENPGGRADRVIRRVPVQDEVAAVPGAGDGPGDEPRARGHRHGRRPLQGAQLPAYERLSRRGRRVRAGSVAEAAGLQVGDRVISVDGKDVPTWRQFYIAIGHARERPVRLVIERDGKRIERQVVPDAIDRFDTGAIGVLPVTHPQIDDGPDGQPGDEGGLRAGDRVLAAGGEAGVSRERLIELIQAHEGSRCALEVAARRRRASQTSPSYAARQSTARCASAHDHAVELKTVEPGLIEAVKLSLRTELGMDRR